ncbi:hypothetical protein NCC49_003949 [Naganishia albida]|nr:hypothetical protein NCC49_003949 [Naganishia albida]
MSTQLPSSRATNGFLAICTTYTAFLLYLTWAFIPTRYLTGPLGWLPDRAWATVVPSWLMLLVLFTYGSYLAMMAYSTPSLDSMSLLVDPRSEIPPMSLGKEMDEGPYDVPVGVVNRQMFPPRRRRV